jgi:hypothetical protein
MAEYRVYILASNGRIMKPVDLECDDDDVARGPLSNWWTGTTSSFGKADEK